MDKELNATLQFDKTERDSDVLDDNEQNNENINHQDILANRGKLECISQKKSYLMLLAKFFSKQSIK